MPIFHDHSVSGPHFELELTSLDQLYGAVYSRRILAFEGLPAKLEYTASVLLKALQATVNAVPFLAGHAIATANIGRPDGRCVVIPGSAHLIINDLTTTVSFAALKEKGFPSSELKHEIYVPAPHVYMPVPGQPHSVCLIQANFVDGGLFLVFCYHHIIADGNAMTQLTRLFASYCAAISSGEDYTNPSSPAPRTAPKLDLNRAAILQNTDAKADPNACLEYYIDFPDLTSRLSFFKPCSNVRHADFRISPGSAAQLKALASSPPTTSNSPSWISTSDAINAIIWRATIRARLVASIIQPSDPVSFSSAVDFRAKLASPLLSGWIGNAFLMVSTEPIPASELVRPGPDGIAAAARAIRASIHAVDMGLISSLLARASSVAHPLLFTSKFFGSLSTTSVLSTSQRGSVYADMEWGRQAFGRYVGMFAPDGGTPMEGFMVMKPDAGTGGWEFTVALAETCMELFKEDAEFKNYARKVDGQAGGVMTAA